MGLLPVILQETNGSRKVGAAYRIHPVVDEKSG
jgi:hypothetical protein